MALGNLFTRASLSLSLSLSLSTKSARHKLVSHKFSALLLTKMVRLAPVSKLLFPPVIYDSVQQALLSTVASKTPPYLCCCPPTEVFVQLGFV